MDQIEEKLGQLLNDPETMQKIMTLAQSLNPGNKLSKNDNAKKEHNNELQQKQLPELDLSVVQKITGLFAQNRVDPNEQTLLNALCPYLSRDRISKLERAMRAAKMARMATALINTSTTGR